MTLWFSLSLSLSLPLSLQQIEESLRSINWDVFTPISSQEEMVDRAEDYEWQDQNQVTVMGGLVFDNIPEGGGGRGRGGVSGNIAAEGVHSNELFPGSRHYNIQTEVCIYSLLLSVCVCLCLMIESYWSVSDS